MTTEERLEKLEQGFVCGRHRHGWSMAATVTIAVIMLIAGLLMGRATTAHTQATAGTTDEVRAHRFILVDATGKERVNIEIVDEGPSLILSDVEGNARAVLSANQDRTSFHMYSSGSWQVLGMLVDKEAAELSVKGQGIHPTGGVLRADLMGATLSLSQGKAKSELSASVWLPGRLTLADAEGKRRVDVHAGNDGPALQLMDKDEVIRTVLGATQTRSPDGKVVSYPESSLMLVDSDGKVRWAAP